MNGHALIQSGLTLLDSLDPTVWGAAGLILLLLGVVWHHARKIRHLEQQLLNQQRILRQELKMMNQGAIGVGNRVKYLEKQVRHQPSPFEQQLVNEAASRAPSTQTAGRPLKSRAEQALADWMKDYRTTA